MTFAAFGLLPPLLGAWFDDSDNERPLHDICGFGSDTDASDRIGTGDRRISTVHDGRIAVDPTGETRR